METFFGAPESEFFYLNEFAFIVEMQADIEQYIHYYNHDSIKLKLEGLSPERHQTQAVSA